jgi:hypothetical protein
MQLNGDVDETERNRTFPQRSSHTGAACKQKARQGRSPNRHPTPIEVTSLGVDWTLGVFLTPRAERPLGFDPILEVLAVLFATPQVSLVGRFSDFFVARLAGGCAVAAAGGDGHVGGVIKWFGRRGRGAWFRKTRIRPHGGPSPRSCARASWWRGAFSGRIRPDRLFLRHSWVYEPGKHGMVTDV